MEVQLYQTSFAFSQRMPEDKRAEATQTIIRKVLHLYTAQISLSAFVHFCRLLEASKPPFATVEMHGFQVAEFMRQFARYTRELRSRQRTYLQDLNIQQNYHSTTAISIEEYAAQNPDFAAFRERQYTETESTRLSDRFAKARFSPAEKARYEKELLQKNKKSNHQNSAS